MAIPLIVIELKRNALPRRAPPITCLSAPAREKNCDCRVLSSSLSPRTDSIWLESGGQPLPVCVGEKNERIDGTFDSVGRLRNDQQFNGD